MRPFLGTIILSLLGLFPRAWLRHGTAQDGLKIKIDASNCCKGEEGPFGVDQTLHVVSSSKAETRFNHWVTNVYVIRTLDAASKGVKRVTETTEKETVSRNFSNEC